MALIPIISLKLQQESLFNRKKFIKNSFITIGGNEVNSPFLLLQLERERVACSGVIQVIITLISGKW